MFALAQEQLEKNKRHSPRRTVEPTLLQSMLVCEQCGYGMYRTSTHTSKQKLNYYRCIGSDGYRRLNGPVCTNRPIRQDYPDRFVWNEIIRLLEDPGLIQTEIDRRREAAKKTDPLRRREEELRREQARVEKSSERLVTACQEGLLTLSQLRQRMPALQKQTQAAESELQSLKMAAVDGAKYLQLAESLAGFRSKLRVRAEVLNIAVRQQILRLLVKEFWWGATPLRCAIQSRFRNPGRGQTDRRHSLPASPDQCRTQVIFCVRGVHSPLLANIYLHYAFDMWIQQWRKHQATGDLVVVRYADDIVVGFENRTDAERFLSEWKERMQKFGLELHPDKTRLIEFGRHASENRKKRGEDKPETFHFMGFTHMCGQTRKTGRFIVKRKTIRKRLSAKLKELKEELRRRWHEPVAEVGKWLKSVVRGYFNYHAVPGNMDSLNSFRAQVIWRWYRAVRRRSQRDRMTWDRFWPLVDRWIPSAKIPHPHPNVRFDAKYLR